MTKSKKGPFKSIVPVVAATAGIIGLAALIYTSTSSTRKTPISKFTTEEQSRKRYRITPKTAQECSLWIRGLINNDPVAIRASNEFEVDKVVNLLEEIPMEEILNLLNQTSRQPGPLGKARFEALQGLATAVDARNGNE